MKNIIIILVIVIALWFFLRPTKATWTGEAAPGEPVQSLEASLSTWEKGKFFITAKASYHVRAVVLSKHSYWSGTDVDKLAPYDLALGWGPMSDAKVINQLNISQSGRWYNYSWSQTPPIDQGTMGSHSANTHIIPADKNVLNEIKRIRKYDVVELDGYLVDVTAKEGGNEWRSSMSRTDTAGGSCEVMWVKEVRR